MHRIPPPPHYSLLSSDPNELFGLFLFFGFIFGLLTVTLLRMDKESLISIDEPKGDFERFLDYEDNRRVFFSGQFGIGKTFFLQKFFEEHADHYDVYHLFPVRYQITSTENIIDLVKYDILVELLTRHPEVPSNNESRGGLKTSFRLFLAFLKDRGSTNGFLSSFIKTGEDALGLFPDPLFRTLSKLGRPLNELLAIDQGFQEFKKKYLAGDKGEIREFMDGISTEIDPVATDHMSHLLQKKIAELKGGKRSVLILDDFDRIDPEHIFRILNVLSAHMEGNETNKFGFDHIIVVGDIRNIQSIFHHRYGEQTEFGGYFDKFFTVSPFEFDNSKAITERIPQLLLRIRCEDPELKEAIGKGGITKRLMERVLARAFDAGRMNLRQLYGPILHPFPEAQKGAYNPDPLLDSRNQCIDIGIKLLIAMYGGKERFLEVLKVIRDRSLSSDREDFSLYEDYAGSMLKHMVQFKVGEQANWLKVYTLEKTEVRPKLAGNEKAHARFFYDTMVEYVERSKYDKRGAQH